MHQLRPPTIQSEAAAMADARRRRARVAATGRHVVQLVEPRTVVYRRLRKLGAAPHVALRASGIALELKAAL